VATILQITLLRYPEIRGGVDAMVVNLTAHLRRRHRVCVLVPTGWDTRSVVRNDVDGVPVYSMRLRMPIDPRRPWRGFFGWLLEFPRTLFRLRSLVRAEGIDLIHAHMGVDHQIYFRCLRWLGGPPYVITLHGSDVSLFSHLSRSSQMAVRFALGGAARVVAVSGSLARAAEKQFPHLSPLPRIFNGLMLPGPEFVAGQMAGQASAVLPERFAVMVGSFDPYKGHDLALLAWGQLKAFEPDLHLVVIGDGVLRASYVSLIAEQECTKTVHLTGQIGHDDVLRIMAAAELMVFPSRSEGLPYVLLEAGAVGIPVVCTRIPVFEEIIDDDVNGLLVPLDEPEALVAAVVRLARDPQLRVRLGSCLREQVQTGFTAEAMTASYEALYQSVLGRPRPSEQMAGFL